MLLGEKGEKRGARKYHIITFSSVGVESMFLLGKLHFKYNSSWYNRLTAMPSLSTALKYKINPWMLPCL